MESEKRRSGTGMIVILDPPHDDGREFIKRVIGLPGDTIHIVDGVVSVNGKRLDEPYVGGVATWTDTNPLTVVVPEGEYFVMGDNRAYMQSNDSRSFGTIPAKRSRDRPRTGIFLRRIFWTH